jgi:hypothetical protein
MDIIITQWALDAYLDLKHRNIFSTSEYWKVIRPDVLLLNRYPNDIKFNNGKFWSLASDPMSKNKLQNGYKMKWHQIGNGKVQLRLTVALLNKAFLCESYEKIDTKQEKRKLAKFKTYIQLIEREQYITRSILL